jgi:hypothetical protein
MQYTGVLAPAQFVRNKAAANAKKGRSKNMLRP